MNPGMRMYMMMQEGQEHNGAERRYADDRQSQPNQYTRNGWPDEPEMRRRRDGNGRYMGYVADETAMPDARYRGRDGQWKPGRRRSEYDGGAYNTVPDERMERGDEENEEMPSNVIPWPYTPGSPHMPLESRMIGFGEREHDRETRSHYDDGQGGQRQTARVGGTMWMEPEENNETEKLEITRTLAEDWVRRMINEDKAHPTGGKWSPDMLKPMAQKYGIPTEGKRFWEFYAMTNAMYSDYGEIARKYGIASPEFYACMAKAWMNDRDANPEKTALYYKYIVKKDT